MTLQEYEEILSFVEDTRKEYPDWRKGQTVFNLLYMHYPQVADSIRGTKHDMYHNDANIEEFKKLIQ